MRQNICLYDTWNAWWNLGLPTAIFTPHFDYEAAREAYCEDHDVERPKEWDGENVDFESDEANFWDEVKRFDAEHLLNRYQKTGLVGFSIGGQLGLWHGKKTITPVFTYSLEKALRKCWGKCDEFRVLIQDGVITCYAWHHDGCNVFTIYGIGMSRMSEKQCEEFLDDNGDGSLLDERWIATSRHIRKINFLKACGLNARLLPPAD